MKEIRVAYLALNSLDHGDIYRQLQSDYLHRQMLKFVDLAIGRKGQTCIVLKSRLPEFEMFELRGCFDEVNSYIKSNYKVKFISDNDVFNEFLLKEDSNKDYTHSKKGKSVEIELSGKDEISIRSFKHIMRNLEEVGNIENHLVIGNPNKIVNKSIQSDTLTRYANTMKLIFDKIKEIKDTSPDFSTRLELLHQYLKRSYYRLYEKGLERVTYRVVLEKICEDSESELIDFDYIRNSGGKVILYTKYAGFFIDSDFNLYPAYWFFNEDNQIVSQRIEMFPSLQWMKYCFMYNKNLLSFSSNS